MTKKNREAVVKIFEAIFKAQDDLRRLAPEFKWTGMGNLLGDYGEYMAIERYDLRKAPVGSDGFDAITRDGQTVQIKANFSAKQIGIRGEANLLLVLSIQSTGQFEEIYFGSFETAKRRANFSSRDNKWMIGVQKLKRMNEESKIKT